MELFGDHEFHSLAGNGCAVWQGLCGVNVAHYSYVIKINRVARLGSFVYTPGNITTVIKTDPGSRYIAGNGITRAILRRQVHYRNYVTDRVFIKLAFGIAEIKTRNPIAVSKGVVRCKPLFQ